MHTLNVHLNINELLIPGGWDHERIDLTDDLQLPNNHNRIFTRVIF